MQGTALQGTAPAGNEWPTALCEPTLACLLQCFGCGCVPLYEIVLGAAPFQVLGLEVPAEQLWAMCIALALWLGTTYGVGQTFGLLMLLAWLVLIVTLKTHLNIAEDDLMTGVKAICCTPCAVGQLREAVKRYSPGFAQSEILGQAVMVQGASARQFAGPVQGTPVAVQMQQHPQPQESVVTPPQQH